MAFVPDIQYNNIILPHIQSISDPLPPKKSIVISGVRGAGSLVIGGGTASYDVVVRGLILASDVQLPDGSSYSKPSGTEYEKIMEHKNYIETSVPAENTDRVLKVEKADGSYNNYTVRRIQPIQYATSQRIAKLEYTITLKVVSP